MVLRLLGSAALTLGLGAVVPPEPLAAVPAYVARGRQTEVRQRAFYQRLDRFHRGLSERLVAVAPDLLPKLTPPPLVVPGYQILPRVIPDRAPPSPPPRPQIVSYSWRWSETLIDQEMAALARLETELARTPPSTEGRAACETMIAGYNQIVAHRRKIEADLHYNWLWQAGIDRDRELYDRSTRLQGKLLEGQEIDAALASADGTALRAVAAARGLDSTQSAESLRAALAERSRALEAEIGPGMGRVDPPPFLRLDEPTPHHWVVTLPVSTDIADAAFLDSFRSAVETLWQLQIGDDRFHLRLALAPVTPEELYCGGEDGGPHAGDARHPGGTDDRAGGTERCAPPARGDAIDLQAHVARFPAGSAVLTTGASTTHVTAGRAIVLGPHDATPRLFAHELGHLIGFPDAYVRGYRDLGADGYQVTELVVDSVDIMGGGAAVLPRHFERLIAVKDLQTTMQAGLAALYERNDPAEAVARFREVLERNPTHYGATFQLAKALDHSGKTGEALVLWRKILEMAEAVGDAETVRTARVRLAGAAWNHSPASE